MATCLGDLVASVLTTCCIKMYQFYCMDLGNIIYSYIAVDLAWTI